VPAMAGSQAIRSSPASVSLCGACTRSVRSRRRSMTHFRNPPGDCQDLGLSPGLESWAMGLYGRVIASQGSIALQPGWPGWPRRCPVSAPWLSGAVSGTCQTLPRQRFRDWFRKKRGSCRQNDQAGEDGQKIATKESQEGDSA